MRRLSTGSRRQRITDDDITGAVIEGIPDMAKKISCGCAFPVTESSSLANHANRWKRLVPFTFVQSPVSALQEHDVSWILVDTGSAVTACPPTHAQEMPFILRERVIWQEIA